MRRGGNDGYGWSGLGNSARPTKPLIVLAIWILLVLTAVAVEERELEDRVGATYLDYSRRVPRFVPYRFSEPP
jgi:protein-S-isoprenylcysteine O-methyltransferase Ste14